MAKYYVQSGSVHLIFDAPTALDAAIRTFQWTCDRQATIEAETTLEHAHIADSRGWQMGDDVVISEVGFGKLDGVTLDTLDVLYAWQDSGVPIS